MTPSHREATITARDVAERLGAELHGDGDRPIEGVGSLAHAGPHDLAFLADSKRARDAEGTKAGALLVPADAELSTDAVLLKVKNPRVAFAQAVAWFHPQVRPAAGVHPTAVVDPSATLGADVHVGPYVVVGARSKVGARAVLHPHVTVYEDVEVGAESVLHAQCVVREGTHLGARCVIQPGAVVGSDGFGYEITPEGTWMYVPQVGRALLGDDVDLGANACIDRGAIDDTVIGEGTKIDNLAQVAHNCTIGAHSMLCGQAGLAGSAHLGHHVVVGGQTGVAGHLTIGDGAQVAGSSGVMNDLEGGKQYGGAPAREFRVAAAIHVGIQRLPDIMKQLKTMEKRLQALEDGAA
ncbi:MAG: UDP-3-O-(3-hydroxymyristoyl)glucosamine N-acyltransferase [Planctomycetes bacterium]|nr:UDP-3-O-(3-hydroxymyristoyl)glucosamine N-acyltransferase [Planctomycetota bacterium]MCB9826017.1 UDP-3-O-(3-hydroxymyristoyl)glucosamine N-acyltransferase [Planctomycetota bacterium]MCB9829227.1 UDP-3-O-(3-hydroxymyristoyl)glucosamine N-acyltransferase [Planctomycetota bacterium]